jgi:uncharacterized DUF497 family protein
MRDVHPAALKHGITVADIRHAMTHPIRVLEGDDRRRVYLGPARNADLLEVITVRRADGSEVAVHAMKMRRKYANLLSSE